MKTKDPYSVYRNIVVRVKLCGYGTRASHIRDLRRLLKKNFDSGSKVISK